MSTTTAPTPAPSPSATENMFTLHDGSKRTQITYRPHRGGPILAGATPNGGSLEYKGPEGDHTYTDDQITTETTALGSLVTVTLNIVPDERTLTFSVLIPQVKNKTSGQAQTFETLGIKAAHRTSLLGQPPAGGNPTYQEMKLTGSAKAVEIAD